jgi:type II secretory pathway component PulM
MNKFIARKRARAAQLKSELEAVRAMIDIAPQDKLEEHYQRAKELNAELRSVNADIAEMETDFSLAPDGFVYANGELITERTAVVNGLLSSSDNKGINSIVRSNAQGQDAERQTRTKYNASKVVFRSTEKLSDKYDVTGIDVDRCLRAAITGNYNDLSDAEKRAVTPTTGGATLAPVVSSIFIDSLRQTNWLQVIAPTLVQMETGEVKIPNISALPTAVMHDPAQLKIHLIPQ